MSSTNYEIRFDYLGSGGEDTSSSTSYQLRDSLGGIPSLGGSSTSYDVQSGFRPGVYDPAVDYDLFIQNSASQVAATALSGTTVTVTSTAGFAGEMIVVIQDEGPSQVSAIGRVSSVGAGTLTVDSWKDGGVTPVIDGSNDLVYALNGSSIDLGLISDADYASSIIAWEVNTDTEEGYSVYVYDDGDLRDGSEVINDVSDGSVTVGSSEYGGRSSDTSLAQSTFDTEDTGFTTSFQQIGSRSGNEFFSRDFLTLKLGVSASQEGGSYSQGLNVVYVGDY